MKSEKKFRFAIDRGGTFTDVFCEIFQENNKCSTKVLKLLSQDPLNYKDAPTEGIRRILNDELSINISKDSVIPSTNIECIRMGTTIATNALLERKGERVAFLTTKGFRDSQIIGNQSRPKIFDLEIKKPDLLYEYVGEIDERIIIIKDNETINNNTLIIENKIVTGISQEKLFVEKSLDEKVILFELQKIKQMGINAIAVCLLHSYIYPEHEKIIGQLAEKMGFSHISLSHEIMPMIRLVPRACTTCVNAYLTPALIYYLKSFSEGFDKELLINNKVSFMQSDGGLTDMSSFNGCRAILSGPAGGVVGFAITSTLSQQYDHDDKQTNSNGSNSHTITTTDTSINTTNATTTTTSATTTTTSISNNQDNNTNNTNNNKKLTAVVGFDMGGTSTDVSRYAGVYEHVFESVTAGVTIQSPQMDINTVAAGGGSRLFFKNGLYVVGPESAGADPGRCFLIYILGVC